MKRLLIGIAILGLAFSMSERAQASLIEFSFSYSGSNVGGGPVSGAGFLFGTEIGNSGTYLLTSGYGTSSEAGNLTLEIAGTWINTYPPTVNLTSDNLLTPGTNPVLDGNGIVFSGSSLPAGSTYFNIWGNGPNSYSYFNNYHSWPIGSGNLDSFTVAEIGPVPEPASITLLASGVSIVGAFGLYRRRRRTATGLSPAC
jgi:hypothetical protein